MTIQAPRLTAIAKAVAVALMPSSVQPRVVRDPAVARLMQAAWGGNWSVGTRFFMLETPFGVEMAIAP